MAQARIEAMEGEASKRRTGVVTLAVRKRLRVDQIRMSIDALREELGRYGSGHGGRFWLFGSAATGRLHYDSDIDIVADFDDAEMAAALAFAERTCIQLRLRPDVSPKSWSTAAFLDRIKSTAVILP